jgi:hypothetical protein
MRVLVCCKDLHGRYTRGLYCTATLHNSPAYFGRYSRVVHTRQDPGVPQRAEDPLDSSDRVGEDFQCTGNPPTWGGGGEGVCELKGVLVCKKCCRVRSAVKEAVMNMSHS